MSLEGLSPSLVVKAAGDYLPLSPALPHHHTDILGQYLAQEPAEHGEGGREGEREGGREQTNNSTSTIKNTEPYNTDNVHIVYGS